MWIKIPEKYVLEHKGGSISTIVNSTYQSFYQHSQNESYLNKKAILTPLNETVDEKN